MSTKHILGAAVLAAFGWAAPALANDVMPLPADATDMEKEAYAMLDKHCARCHQDGALKEGLPKAKSGFGHVLDIRRLAQDTKFVIQGQPTGSKLYDVIGQYSFPAMPDDCTTADCFPTQAEMMAVSTWITELANQAPPPREFVPLTKMFEMAQLDLAKQPTNRRDRIRYLSLRPLHNDTDVTTENLEGYKSAAVKLVNALSWNPIPYKFEPVDEYGILMRIYLPEIAWEPETWHRLEAQYPYAVESATDPHLTQLQHMSGTAVPIIRADWFAATAPVSPLYYDLLGLPDTVAGLEDLLNLDMIANIRNQQVIRAGFQNSGVSTNNRLIERHALNSGFFWTSYDFAGSKGRQSFFQYPLGPKEAFGETHAFLHDGGESIFTLPNGFHAYYLNTAEGERLDVGPTSIVRDDDYSDGTGEVVNGISCISCHSKGIRLNEDRVRDVAINDFSLPAEARQVVDQIYPGQDEVAKYLEADTQQFFGAMRSAGLDPEITAGGLEPIRGLFVYHVDRFINFAQAANELGMSEDMLRQRAAFVGHDMASLIMRLDQSPIARDEWTAAYPAILEKVTEYRPLVPQHRFAADLSHSVQKVLADTPYAAPPPPAHKPVAPAPQPTSYADATKAPDYVPTQHSAPAQSHLTVYTDKPSYTVGEGMKIIVEPRHDCRLTLINIDDQKRSCVLYPHPALPDEVIPGGSQYVFPPRGSLKTQYVGVETILAICNGGHEAISKEVRDTSQVSCDVSHNQSGAAQYKEVVNEVLALDLGSDDKATLSGATYRAVSTHNPTVAKAQISAHVTAH
ncbi:DUF4384 domain-containing protein [Tropicibacter oceani]|uniref:DUF4384 domain-containing protein n=1 Tax=Tropicibacter oceani TaxID=3058420 RepID=A0ABY8QND7_9RHOB|nr:DUF4384 domain-containing protein [Tropicibacter oceani]WGW05536.1 DUF4384 domain-containing protein [Tropicibacter oceani]